MSLEWTARYSDKVSSAQQAIALIRPGRRILIGSGAAEPLALVDALCSHGDHLADNEIIHILTLGPAPYVAPAMQGRFRHTAFFIGPNVREAVQEGRADFTPVFLSEIPRLIRTRRVRIDVALIQVSPPDAHGFVSLGVSVDVVRAAVDTAELILAEVNPRMPRTLGDSFLHVDRISRLVPVDAPLLERTPEPLDDEVRAIGEHVASLVPNGATLQVGIGAIPDAVMASLGRHRDLGVHTEMLADGLMELAEAGVVTGKEKTLIPGKMVASFVMGTRKLYDWVHDNPLMQLMPTEFVNSPQMIALNAKMVSINTALAVDLTGQVASDTLDGRFYSGIGGQVDFIRGASQTAEGRAIIAIRSTAKQGTVSRIQPVLDAGTAVVTTRGDVHYVVTEYGIADLWGKSVRERALALTSIAHPSFRAELLAAGKARRYVLLDQPIPKAIYPWQEERAERLPGGERLRLRPVKMTDERPLQDFYYRLSEESTRRRFFAAKAVHSHQEMQRLVDLDYEHAMMVVACPEGGEEIVGVIAYQVDPGSRLADISYVVRDDWQSRGVATALMRRIREIALARGLAGFTADVQSGNAPALAVLHESGLKLTSSLSDGVFHLVGQFDGASRP